MNICNMEKSTYVLTKDLKIGDHYFCPIRNENYGCLYVKVILDYEDKEKMKAIYKLEFKNEKTITLIVRKSEYKFIQLQI